MCLATKNDACLLMPHERKSKLHSPWQRQPLQPGSENAFPISSSRIAHSSPILHDVGPIHSLFLKYTMCIPVSPPTQQKCVSLFSYIHSPTFNPYTSFELTALNTWPDNLSFNHIGLTKIWKHYFLLLINFHNRNFHCLLYVWPSLHAWATGQLKSESKTVRWGMAQRLGKGWGWGSVKVELRNRLSKWMPGIFLQTSLLTFWTD